MSINKELFLFFSKYQNENNDIRFTSLISEYFIIQKFLLKKG